MQDAISTVRDSSRRIVRELGFLKARHGRTGLSHTQCHALLEIDRAQRLTVTEIARLLRIEKSTASRAVSPLVRSGLLRRGSGADGRSQPLALAAKGRRKIQAIDTQTDTEVGGALGLLSAADRTLACRGLALYARALERARVLSELEVRPIRKTDEAAMEAVIHGVMTEYGAVGEGFSINDPEVRAMAKAYRPARHLYFVALRDGRLLGGAGIAPLTGGKRGVCELRKMYLLPDARGLGLGRRLLTVSLDAARRAGFRLIYLETLGHMSQARGLYESFGFEALDAPMGKTGHGACNAWYSLRL